MCIAIYAHARGFPLNSNDQTLHTGLFKSTRCPCTRVIMCKFPPVSIRARVTCPAGPGNAAPICTTYELIPTLINVCDRLFVDDGGELYSHHYLLRTSNFETLFLVNSHVLCIIPERPSFDEGEKKGVAT